MQPKVITDIELAFPAHVVGKYLPEWDTIPHEFRNYHSPWCRYVQSVFGGQPRGPVKVREGIDLTLAGRHLHACLGSYEPKHEHKIAGVAYLMSLWFEAVEDET